MEQTPVFLTLVLVLRNAATQAEALLAAASRQLSTLASDHEIIVVDNASTDDSLVVYRQLTGEDGIANLQVFALTKEVDSDTASWVGLENALGDYIAVLDPLTDDIAFLPSLLARAVEGADVVFARNTQRPAQSVAYRFSAGVFNRLYRWFNGIDLAQDAPQYRLLSRRVVNFILQHPQPALTYRHLPATGGFARANLSYAATPRQVPAKRLGDSIDRGMRMLVSTTRAPMRMVTTLSLFGAVSNLVYSGYVLAVWMLKDDVAPGWVSLSLQQSGMFFLLSLVLLVLGEYILNMASLTNEGPRYHIAREFTSARMLRREKLNIREDGDRPGGAGPRHA